jgi:anti-sigma factor RsiW
MRSITDEDLILMHYQELEPPSLAELREALAQDPALAARYRALQRTLAAADAAPVPAPDAALAARVWARVEPRLGLQQDAEPAWRRAGPWLAFAASAAIVALGVARWDDLRPASAPLMASAPSTAAAVEGGAASISAAGRERVLLTRVAHHLDGSQRLFASVSNSEAGLTDVEAVRDWAQRTLGANRVYRSAAAEAGEKRVVALLDAMEPLLIEIANAPDSIGADELAFLQQRIAEADLLFRVRSTQKRIEQRANQDGPRPVQEVTRFDI